jgi:hypothetical protein
MADLKFRLWNQGSAFVMPAPTRKKKEAVDQEVGNLG